MKERPILFSSGMVKAILSGRKTQTRRVIKPQSLLDRLTRVNACYECPYGAPNDQLWVRETWWKWGGTDKKIGYRADESTNFVPAGGYRPSFFMPRCASRLTLEITDVRVERLQEISESDSVAEGLVSWPSEKESITHYGLAIADVWEIDPRLTYKRLWDSINAKSGHSWDSNPWVWVIEFRRKI